ncbi:MAG: pyruvate dehydrogenase complex dihydrolipoamide acetyltransferase, partial [Candidatus Thioglobus sp.]
AKPKPAAETAPARPEPVAETPAEPAAQPAGSAEAEEIFTSPMLRR